MNFAEIDGGGCAELTEAARLFEGLPITKRLLVVAPEESGSPLLKTSKTQKCGYVLLVCLP
jgi:hypothetical protein